MSFFQVLGQYDALGFNQSRWLLYYHNDMEIVLANSSSRDVLAKWTMDDGLAVKPNVTLAPTKRFFRVGTAEVTREINFCQMAPHILKLSTSFMPWPINPHNLLDTRQGRPQTSLHIGTTRNYYFLTYQSFQFFFRNIRDIEVRKFCSALPSLHLHTKVLI